MPDWITHILVAWTLCTILGFKYRQFNPANTALCMVGALIPDTFKIVIPLGAMGIHVEEFIAPFHLPAGSLIIASIFALFFKEQKTALSFLVLGVSTHYALDLLLTNLNGGIHMLFPFSWAFWQFDIISNDNLSITLLSIALAVSVYLISFWQKKRTDSGQKI